MKIIAALVLIWLAVLIAGAFFGVLGKLIWLAVLATAFAVVYSFWNKDEVNPDTVDGPEDSTKY